MTIYKTYYDFDKLLFSYDFDELLCNILNLLNTLNNILNLLNCCNMKFISYCCLQGTPPPFTEFYSHMCHDHCHFTTQGGLVQPEWLTAPIVPDSLFSFGAPVASPYYPPHCADAVFLYHPAILRQSAKILRGPRDCCSNCCFCCRSCYVAVSVLVGIMRNGFVRICVSCGCF